MEKKYSTEAQKREAQKRALSKYLSNKAQLKITILPEQRERYQQHAKSKGISLTKLIVNLLEKDIEDSK